MTTKMWWIAGALLALLFVAAVVSLRSTLDLKHAEDRVDVQKTAAERSEQAADKLEKTQNEQRAKIEYLERELEMLRNETRRNDEELKKNNVGVRVARDRVERAKRTRTIDKSVDELCRQLESLGHVCEAR
ncbi:MAG: hypothetical protein DYH05_04490 [Acidobacteria bacterium ACB1]|nr:hypothetical protein [Pyrinomonadaceae bacterium]MCE7961740.1 hypothetical protein [Acidobacteria bacterium ACB1]RIJ93917.1 MAG: hypothetical protein DCC44_06140 [Acidobacteriota bacterium]